MYAKEPCIKEAAEVAAAYHHQVKSASLTMAAAPPWLCKFCWHSLLRCWLLLSWPLCSAALSWLWITNYFCGGMFLAANTEQGVLHVKVTGHYTLGDSSYTFVALVCLWCFSALVKRMKTSSFCIYSNHSAFICLPCPSLLSFLAVLLFSHPVYSSAEYDCGVQAKCVH
jgi:hypothetical protein